MRFLAWSVALCLVALPAAAAPNEKVAQAQKLFDDLDVDGAGKALDAATAAGNLDRASLIQLYVLQGLIRATLGRAALARDAFYRLLLLEPTYALPKNQPPRVRTPFFEAKGMAAEHGPTTAEPAVDSEPGAVKQLSVAVKKDVLKLARAVVFTVRDAGGERRARVELQDGVAALAVSGPKVTWSAAVLGDRDNVILEVGTASAPLEAVASPVEVGPVAVEKPTPGAGSPPSGWKRPTGFVVAGAGVVAGVAGLILGGRSQSLRETLGALPRDDRGVVTGLTQREAFALDADAQGSAVAANVLFVSAGVLVAAGVGLVVWAGLEAPVIVAPAPGGVVVSGTF